MTDEEALKTIGKLVREARENLGLNRNAAAMRCGIQHQTLTKVEEAARPASPRVQRGIERGLNLREGSLHELWENRVLLKYGTINGGFVAARRAPVHEPAPTPANAPVLKLAPVTRAADLTTAELMAELSFRILILGQHQGDDDD